MNRFCYEVRRQTKRFNQMEGTRVKQRFRQFMQGRYGLDQLYVGMLVLYFILLFFSRWFMPELMTGLMTLVIILAVFRMFSKNIVVRQRENAVYLRVVNGMKHTGKKLLQRIKDIPTKRYRKCPNCAVTLRLPRKRGRHKTTCPKCQTSFEVKIRM